MAVRDLLEHYSLFVYDDDAHSEIRQMFEHLGGDAYTEVRRDLAYVSAAEVALVGLIFSPKEAPIEVSGSDARIALAKANCTPFSGSHGPTSDADIRAWDVMLFAGDMSKLQLLGYSDPADLRSRLVGAVEELEQRYRESPVSWARELVENGYLRLQALLWAARISLLLNPQDPQAAEREIADQGGKLGVLEGELTH
jgi:hypothetical protein